MPPLSPESTPAGATSPEFGPAVAAFYATQVEHARLVQHLAMSLAINPVDLRAVKFLGSTDHDITPKELSRYLAMGTGAITALVDRLVGRDFVERVRNPADRRSVSLRLTEDGAGIVSDLQDAYGTALQSSLPAQHIPDFVTFNEELTRRFRSAAEV